MMKSERHRTSSTDYRKIMLIMYSAEALSRGAHFSEESSQVDAAVKAHSLAAVFAVCKTIVEFLEKELASDPS